MKKIRWGIISTAAIGKNKVIPAMQQGAHTDICAIASSDIAKAKAAAQKLNIPKQYGSYAGLLDIGSYCVSLARFLFNGEPQRVFGDIQFDPQSKIDALTSGVLEFRNGRSTFTCSTQLTPSQHAVVFGTKGKIVIELPFTPPLERPTHITVQNGSGEQTIAFEPFNQYTAQGDLFSLAILRDEPVPTPLTDALANMKVIDGVFESARSNGWIEIKE